MRNRLIATICFLLLAATALQADARRGRRALLVGIDDYSASHMVGFARTSPPSDRDWPALSGSTNDVAAMKQMLMLLYGFDARDIVTLTDQSATRAAIIAALDALATVAEKNDTLFFYYAGHGSQVRNSRSDEPDKLDESVVPADSRAGAADIRDKELRRYFNVMLDRGARLTVLLDNCHSGSGARGLPTGATARGIKPDLRDVADGTPYGPRPEARGALLLSASQDFDSAWETRDESGRMHGAFSWAWMRALRDAPLGEPAFETFVRAQARLHAERPYQDAVLAGNDAARLSPFLGLRTDRMRADGRTVVAVQKVRRDGTIILEGGWANGLAVGSELRVVNDTPPARHMRDARHIVVTALRGLASSEAHAQPLPMNAPAIASGVLLESVGWAAPPARRLRICVPRLPTGTRELAQLGRDLAHVAARHGVRWIDDPVAAANSVTGSDARGLAMYLLRHAAGGWELLSPAAPIRRLVNVAAAMAAIAALPRDASLFVQLPAPSTLADAIARSAHQGIERVSHAEEADYVLVGRVASSRLAYAWVRPGTQGDGTGGSGIPSRSDWLVQDGRDATVRRSASLLHDSLQRLRRIQAWQLLESPPAARWAYCLALRHEPDGALVDTATDRTSAPTMPGGSTYSLALAARATLPARVAPRYVYAFVVDSYGKSVLLFPRSSGSVENRFPYSAEAGGTFARAAAEIELGPRGSLQVEAPFGADTYVLLTTDEPLPNPWILEWDGVRTRDVRAPTALERLLLRTTSGMRSARIVTPANWSIERQVVQSISPHVMPAAK